MGIVKPGPWKLKCAATSKRTGEPCQRFAMQGGTVCYMHGGKNGRVKAKAAERTKLIEDRIKELGDQAVTTLREVLDDPTAKPEVRVRAAESVLDRIVGKKIEAEVTKAEERDLDREIEEELGELPAPLEEPEAREESA